MPYLPPNIAHRTAEHVEDFVRFRVTLGLFGALFMSWISTAHAAPHPELDVTAVGGIEVFRDEMKLLMDRNLELVAVSGYVPSSGLRASGAAPAFQLSSAQAIDAAVRDFSDGTANATSARRLGSAPGGFERFQM